MVKVCKNNVDKYFPRMDALTEVVELRNQCYQLQKKLSRSGQYSENAGMENFFNDLATLALKIPMSSASSSSSPAKSPEPEPASQDESMANTSSSLQNIAPPVILPGNRTSSHQDATYSTSSTDTQLPLQPQVIPQALPTNNVTHPRINSCRRKPSLGLRKRFATTGIIGINKLHSANRMTISKKRRPTRATRNAAPQYLQYVESNDETTEFADPALLAEFNDALLANNLSGQDRAHAALYKIVEQTLDPLQWRMKPNTEAVRKLLVDDQVKTRIRDFILEHLQYGFHIDRSPECVNKFLDDMANCILPSEDSLRKSFIKYFANCAKKPSTNFGFAIKLMFKLHETYCSVECVQNGSLYWMGWRTEIVTVPMEAND